MSESNSNALPPGWCWTTLSQIADLKGGITKGQKRRPTDVLRSIPYLRVANVQRGFLDLDDVKHIEATEAEIAELRLEPGDILFNEGGDRDKLGRGWVWSGDLPECIHQNHVFRARLYSRQLQPKLISLYGNSAGQRYFIGEGKQTTNLASINLSKLGRLPIPLPPAAEQRHILDEIEKHFTRLDAAVAALKRAQANLKRYRAAVFKAACEGRLVPTEAELARREGREYESAERLLQRILAERRARWEAAELTATKTAGRAPKGARKKTEGRELRGPNPAGLPSLPEGWFWACVEQVGDVKIGRQRSPKHHVGPHMRPYLRVANVFDDRLDLSDVMQMNFDPREFEEYRLVPGDILLNEGQSPELLGRPALFRGEIDGVCFQNTLVRFRSLPELVPEYALLVFRKYMHNGRFRRLSRQTTNIAHLGGDRFAKVEFPLPPIAEQRRIVAEAERVLSIAKKMDEASLSNVKRANAMRQAILKRAFEGKLVPQDLNDEPASALLERMQADRADQALLHRAKPIRGTDERLADQQLPLPV